MSTAVGIVELWWDGTKYDVRPGTSLKLPALKNEARPVGTRTVRVRSFQPGQVQATLVLETNMSLATFSPGDEKELQVRADTGQAWVFPNACITEAPSMKDNGGELQVTWVMDSYEETVS